MIFKRIISIFYTQWKSCGKTNINVEKEIKNVSELCWARVWFALCIGALKLISGWIKPFITNQNYKIMMFDENKRKKNNGCDFVAAFKRNAIIPWNYSKHNRYAHLNLIIRFNWNGLTICCVVVLFLDSVRKEIKSKLCVVLCVVMLSVYKNINVLTKTNMSILNL